jgi:hypothetical protein
MITKKVNLDDLERGPTQHQTLSPDLIQRITAYKAILGAADPSSIDAAIDDFRRDLNPDKKVAIWERITHVFQQFTAGHQITTTDRRREVLRALLLLSAGAEVDETGTLTHDQITN